MYKLTLSIEKEIAGQAKKLASEQNTSVSAMFSQWIQAVASGSKHKISLGRITRQVSGVIQLPDGKSEKDILAETLEEKYGISQKLVYCRPRGAGKVSARTANREPRIAAHFSHFRHSTPIAASEKGIAFGEGV